MYLKLIYSFFVLLLSILLLCSELILFFFGDSLVLWCFIESYCCTVFSSAGLEFIQALSTILIVPFQL